MVLAGEDEWLDLSCGDERTDDVANARARCQRREEELDVLFRGENGLTQIERDERGERSGKSSVGTGLDLLGVAGGGELPEGGSAIGLGNRKNAEMLPELGESAKCGGFGDLIAEFCGEFGCAEAALGDEDVVGRERQRGDLGGSAGDGRLLPCFIAAKGKEIGQNRGCGEEVRGLGTGPGGRAEEMKRNDSAFGDESREKDAGLLELSDGRGGGLGAEDGLREAGSRNSKLRTRCEENQTGGVDPLAKLVEGKKGLRVVVPVREACGGKLASRWSQ